MITVILSLPKQIVFVYLGNPANTGKTGAKVGKVIAIGVLVIITRAYRSLHVHGDIAEAGLWLQSLGAGTCTRRWLLLGPRLRRSGLPWRSRRRASQARTATKYSHKQAVIRRRTAMRLGLWTPAHRLASLHQRRYRPECPMTRDQLYERG